LAVYVTYLTTKKLSIENTDVIAEGTIDSGDAPERSGGGLAVPGLCE
jgi:hypothetical protein